MRTTKRNNGFFISTNTIKISKIKIENNVETGRKCPNNGKIIRIIKSASINRRHTRHHSSAESCAQTVAFLLLDSYMQDAA